MEKKCGAKGRLRELGVTDLQILQYIHATCNSYKFSFYHVQANSISQSCIPLIQMECKSNLNQPKGWSKHHV